jgi:hypothetical protein
VRFSGYVLTRDNAVEAPTIPPPITTKSYIYNLNRVYLEIKVTRIFYVFNIVVITSQESSEIDTGQILV